MHEAESKATHSARLNELGSDNREQLLDVGLPALVGLRGSTATTRAGDQGWLRSDKVLSIAKNVAFWGSSAATLALAALVVLSDGDILRGAPDIPPKVTPIQSDSSNVSRTEPIAMPGSAADRSKAGVETSTPEKQVVNDSASSAPHPSRPGELPLSLSGPMQEAAIAVRETVAVAPREMDAPPQSDAGQLDTIEKSNDSVA